MYVYICIESTWVITNYPPLISIYPLVLPKYILFYFNIFLKFVFLKCAKCSSILLKCSNAQMHQWTDAQFL